MLKKALLVLSLLFSTMPAFADTITVQPFSNDSTTTHLDNFRSTVVNVINGNIEGSGSNGSTKNIKADSLGELDMADEINPRLRDRELLNVGVDTTTSQTSFVYTGLIPATDSDLTSDISAGTAYINGYRVVKTATTKTYTASMDTYIDLSQTGNYTFSEVTIGATAPVVAANSARIAKVTTSGTAITSVTDLANRRITGLLVPSHYRTGLIVSRDTATRIAIYPGSAEINNTMINKTDITRLTISTAGDWAGGSSLQAAATFGFVGMDASGNLKLHTTAPTHDNYGVSTTSGKKRYATWSSTVYRTLGWFFMDGAQVVEVASNIKEGDVANAIQSTDLTATSLTSTSYIPAARVRFYSSGGPVNLLGIISGDAASGTDQWDSEHQMDGTTITGSENTSSAGGAANYNTQLVNPYLQTNVPQASHTYTLNQRSNTGNAVTILSRKYIVREE